MSQSTAFERSLLSQSLRVRMIGIVDSIPETAGLGVACFDGRHMSRLRAEGDSGATVVFEIFDRHFSLQNGASASVIHRNAQTSPAMEWLSAGFNCGGTVLAWVGVAGTAALAPVTGGLTALGTAALWGGALASSAQCAVSGYRMLNVERGRTDLNDDLDNNNLYVYTMNGLDVVGLVGAGGALKEIKETNAILKEAGSSWKIGTSQSISRPMRRRLTMALELQGGKRAAAVDIDRVLRQRLLDATAGVIGLVGSSTTGFLKDVVVWITSEGGADAPAP